MPDYSGWGFFIPIFILIIYNIAGISGWLPFKAKGQALHDQLAGTIVLQKVSFKNKVSILSIVLIPFIIFILTFKIFLMWSIWSFNIITIVPTCANKAWLYRLVLKEDPHNGGLYVVKSHMFALQEMLEFYKKSTGGIYPKNLQELSISPYWKELRKPYCFSMSKRDALMDYKYYKQSVKYSGCVLYESIGNPPKSYYIYGCDIKGELRYKLYNGPPYLYDLKEHDLKDREIPEAFLKQLFPFFYDWILMSWE